MAMSVRCIFCTPHGHENGQHPYNMARTWKWTISGHDITTISGLNTSRTWHLTDMKSHPSVVFFMSGQSHDLMSGQSPWTLSGCEQNTLSGHETNSGRMSTSVRWPLHIRQRYRGHVRTECMYSVRTWAHDSVRTWNKPNTDLLIRVQSVWRPGGVHFSSPSDVRDCWRTWKLYTTRMILTQLTDTIMSGSCQFDVRQLST